MPRSEAQKRATRKWNDEHMTDVYERITMLVPKGRKRIIVERAKTLGNGTLSGYLNMLVRADLGFDDETWKNVK